MYYKTVYIKFKIGEEEVSFSICIACSPSTLDSEIVARAKKALDRAVKDAYIYVS